jgi:hypothetical protein
VGSLCAAESYAVAMAVARAPLTCVPRRLAVTLTAVLPLRPSCAGQLVDPAYVPEPKEKAAAATGVGAEGSDEGKHTPRR